MPQRSCARRRHQSANRGERLAKERLRCYGLDASVACRRIHFRRMPSVNDGPSDMSGSGFATTSLLAGSPTSRITYGSGLDALKLWKTSMWSQAIYIIGMAVLGAGIGYFVTLIRPGRERLGILGTSIVTLVGIAILTSILVLSQF